MDQQAESSRAEALVNQVTSALCGVKSVDGGIIVRLTQRLILLRATGTWPTKLALRMGRPGLELINPAELAIPPTLDPTLAEQMRASLEPLHTLMLEVAAEVQEYLNDRALSGGRLRIPEEAEYEVPPDAIEALLHEITILVAAAPPAQLESELELLLMGAALLLKQSDGARGVGLARKLMHRLPGQKEHILSELIWHCSPTQIVILQGRSPSEH